jgi:isopentenyldiphosphate isomerase
MQYYNKNTTDDQKELLTEVDENDNVIGPVARETCHNQTTKPWHRTTSIYIFNVKGEIYLTRKSKTKDTGASKLNISASGHVDFGDSYKETAKRELEEELGLNTELEEIDYLKIDTGYEKEFMKIYAGITKSRPEINKEEVEEIFTLDFHQFMDDSKDRKFDFPPGAKDSIEQVLKTGSLEKFWNKHFKK